MSLSGNKGRLGGAAKELALKWAETKNYWRDAKSQEFESKYLQELWVTMDKSITIMEKLDELLRRIEKDCE